MTVGADNIALLDLCQDVLPRSIAQALADAELFVAQMIELQDDGVALPTVNAGALAKERDEIGSALGDDSFLAPVGGVDIALSIAGVVLVLISGPTRPAIVVVVPALSAPPGEFVQRLLLIATPTALHSLAS
jgi:hypothetical protein